MYEWEQHFTLNIPKKLLNFCVVIGENPQTPLKNCLILWVVASGRNFINVCNTIWDKFFIIWDFLIIRQMFYIKLFLLLCPFVQMMYVLYLHVAQGHESGTQVVTRSQVWTYRLWAVHLGSDPSGRTLKQSLTRIHLLDLFSLFVVTFCRFRWEDEVIQIRNRE